jgi:hypothetical protein
LLTHAANPLPVHLRGDVYRVFYSGRDASNRSSVGVVDIDLRREVVVADHDEPAFVCGPAGSFYADGVSIGCCYRAGGVRYMLFMGWQWPPDSHWRGDIGRLVVEDDMSLALDDDVPFLGSDRTDPISLSYPWVTEDEDQGFRMWYGSTQTWDGGNGEMIHTLNAATSADGHTWKRTGPAVPMKLGAAQAFSRPTVAIDSEGEYDMWFSYRGGPNTKYRIGRAHSPDADVWELDLTGLTVPPGDGWEADMVEYPSVLTHDGRKYMLYNGDGYGRTGFGLAVLEDG